MTELRKTPAAERVLSAEQLALVLNISEWTVKKLARSGQIPCEYANRRPRFALEKLEEFFGQLEGVAA